jgi:VWFA-related protein
MAAMREGPLHRRSNIGRLRPVSYLRLSLLLIASLPLAFSAQSPQAQQPQASPSQAPSSQTPVYTLHGATRIVLTDVTVKDRAGHVIHGLPASAFHISDDNQPQTISSFEEHNNAPTAIAALPASAPDTYSNEFLNHLPPVLNIVVLDTTSLSLIQQMYLAYEFNNFLKTLPPDLPLALYARVGEIPVLVQDFTSDRKLLLAASAKVMPHLPPPGRDPVHITDNNLLQELGVELSQLPGHKNILWFSGGEAGISFDPRTYSDPTVLQSVYDQLELARISVYPIDARGLTVGGAGRMAQQHLEMREIADNTGGEPFYNGNGLAKDADQILEQDNSFYTLVFSPQNFHPDNKWHQVKVKVDGGSYALSYRRGYFADGNNLGPKSDDRPRTLLLAGGDTKDLPADLHSAPIIFTASIAPVGNPPPTPGAQFYALNDNTSAKKGTNAYSILYSLPPDVLETHTVDGRESASFEVAVLGFNKAGEQVVEKGDRVSVKFPHDDPHEPVDIAQSVGLPRGDLYLFIAIWDLNTGRTGTLQIPLTAH